MMNSVNVICKIHCWDVMHCLLEIVLVLTRRTRHIGGKGRNSLLTLEFGFSAEFVRVDLTFCVHAKWASVFEMALFSAGIF
jgi:hypothetical protein